MDGSLESKTAAYLTHELRAPLTAIRCALEALAEEGGGPLPPERGQTLAIALRNAERLRLLIDDILDLSKLQAGQMRLFPIPCDLEALVRETAEGLLPWARRKGIDLRVRAEGPFPRVLADPRRSAQVLTNLLSNAIKFTPAGGRVEVVLERGSRDDAGALVVSVRDTGCGIAAEDQSRVFGYFVQAGPPEQRGSGTGLGLPLARSMVELQGGRLALESAPGQGSTFSFTLPVYLPVAERAAAGAAAV